MNSIEMWDVAYCFPYVALAARHNEDSGDEDSDFNDFVDDLAEMWLSGSKIHKFFYSDTLDFVYAIEHDNKLLIAFLGTQGRWYEGGWFSNASIGLETNNFVSLGGHVSWINSGKRIADDLAYLVRKPEYRYNFYVVMHSRGGATGLAAVRHWYDSFSAVPIRAIPFCSPPVFNHRAADEYDKCGLGSVTIRPTMSNDPVESTFPITLKHVGVEIKLPKIKTAAIIQHGFWGPAVYGHAYSSVFESLQKYCLDRNMTKEWNWLEETKWVATI